MSKLVIFCESYDEIETALYLLTHNRQGSSTTLVIPGNHDLFKFFKVINERLFHNSINIIYFGIYYEAKPKANRISKWIRLLNVIGERIYLRRIYQRYFSGATGAEVYFLSRYFNQYDFYFLKKLSKRNRLMYMHFGHYADDVKEHTPANIRDWLHLIRLRLVYGLDINMGKLPYTKPFAHIPDKFMEKEVNRIIDYEERNEMMKSFDLSQFKIFDVSDYSVIYFDQDLIGGGYISDSNTFKRELTQIFNILSKHFPAKKIARKYHPKHNSDKTMIKTGDILPDFIPAEFLYNDNTKIYLSLFSNSIANLEKGLAVSIADLITFRDEETREQLKEGLIQRSRSEILFPKSLDEFEKILINIKQQAT